MTEFKNSYLMLIAAIASFGLLYFLLFKEIPDKNIQIFVFLAGMVCGFFFGSSLNKSKILDPTVPAIPNDPAGQ